MQKYTNFLDSQLRSDHYILTKRLETLRKSLVD